ncbi:sensor histidine kinase KdpD [Novosphingobium sp. Fuku2-ISO-50]|uniref:sensor histidine kinase n=1 Tax=Novosphingobium sp. Fuku2-ISO-50 TaxID=1739114 RepID=UPI00076CBA4E|nr:HAMP domain-containing sensor histidine kinase [Novosphingobium sp. Fuku2-ISO-50]KUR79688.1 histidine kinase [Novosphingobium sp. Fuku2-ISO-50]
MSNHPAVLGLCDEADRLIEADEPLAGLQLRCGGDLPGIVAVPALLTLVRRTRASGIAQSGMLGAVDEGKPIAFFAQVAPDGAGTRIALSHWRLAGEAVPDSGPGESLLYQIAAVHAVLDADQRVLAADVRAADHDMAADAPALAGLAERWLADRGRPWSEAVDLLGVAHRQPLHWRLIDDVAFRLAGSPRVWRARLLPRGEAGFDLLVLADGVSEIPGSVSPEPAPAPPQGWTRLIGRDLAPALRQPINRIVANAETIRTRLAGPLVDEYAGYAADIAEAGRHLLALVEDLADLDAVEAPEFSPAPDRIDLADCARRAAGILAMRAAERGIALITPPDDQRVPAIGEFRRVLQILLNLLTNAIRYGPEHSSVRIETGGDVGTAWIAVSDEGEGLHEDQASRVFDKFERLGRTGDGGSGLGLYISRRLARAMGGDLVVAGQAGSGQDGGRKGARFVLTLPGRSQD